MKTNDYEKEEKRSFKGYETSDLRKTYNEPNERLAHKAGFRDGYQLGKEHAVEVPHSPDDYLKADGNVMIGTLHTNPVMPSLRTAAAIAAMQGILTNGQSNSVGFIVKKAVSLADALLKELGERKE